MVLGLGSLALSLIAAEVGDSTLSDISSAVSLIGPAGMKCYAAWGLSDQTDSVGAEAAYRLKADYAATRIPVASAQLGSKALSSSTIGSQAGPTLGVIAAVIDTGFTIRDIEEQYGFGFEETSEDAFGQSDDFETCIAAGNEDSIFISKD